MPSFAPFAFLIHLLFSIMEKVFAAPVSQELTAHMDDDLSKKKTKDIWRISTFVFCTFLATARKAEHSPQRDIQDINSLQTRGDESGTAVAELGTLHTSLGE